MISGLEILLQGIYPYIIPSPPEDETKILNWDIKDPLEQYWRIPHAPNFEKISAYEKAQYIEEEDRRLREGIHFWNKGEIVYINGAHYEYLVYWKTDYEVRFLHVDRLYFYFDEFVDNYTPAYGKVTFKPRRGGFSGKENFLAYRKSRAGLYKNVVLLNTTLDNAKDINYTQISNAYNEYPIWLRPIIDQKNISDVPKMGMIYKKLKGYVKPKAPLANSVDGKKIAYLVWDEVFKLPSADPQVVLTAFYESLYDKINDCLVGKLALVSTLGEDDRLMGQAIDFAKNLWSDSDISKANEQGATASKLLRYFISAFEVLAIDKWGFSDEQRAMEIYETEIREIIEKHGEHSFEHISFLRKNPRTIEDILNSPKAGSSFNGESRVTKQREAVYCLPIEKRGYVGGKFIMDNGVVTFDTSEKYKDYGWKIKGIVLKNYRLCRRSGYDWVLPKKPEGTVGYDPVLLDQPISKHISQPSILIFKKLDHHAGNGIKNQFQGAYVGGRKIDNDEVTEQAAFAAIYFGYILSPERNTGVHLKFLKNNYYNGLMRKWSDGGFGIQITTAKGEKNVLDAGVNSIYKWVIGKQENGTPNIETLTIEEVLGQFESFTSDRLPTHDHIAAAIQAKLCADKFIEDENVTRKPTSDVRGLMTTMFPVFATN